MEIFGYVGALLMGISLGLIGGGGSIIALPILVYLFHINPDLAVVYSLFIVGGTALFAFANHVRAGNFEPKVALRFGAASVLSVVVSRYYIVPNIPIILATINGFEIKKSLILLLLFAVLMLFAATKMIFAQNIENTNQAVSSQKLIVSGFSIGFLTGLIGAGGGFLIVPTLVYYANLPMKKAIGTSLLIIGINALIGFAISTLQNPTFDWSLLISFLSIAFIGTFAGAQLSKKVSNQALKPVFGGFVLVMGIYIIIKELFLS
jgi:uncharacterized protein